MSAQSRVRFNFWVKAKRLSYRYLSLIDFLRRGEAPPQRINLLLRPVGAPEVFTPVLKRAPSHSQLALYPIHGYHRDQEVGYGS